MASEVDRIKRELKRKHKSLVNVSKSSLLSIGSTTLNLACSGRVEGAIAKGLYMLLVGDSDSGKTWFTLSLLAEAANNPHFSDYRLIYDGPEGGALMDLRRYFGSKMVARFEAPKVDGDGQPIYSGVVEDFYFNLDDAAKGGQPFVYILDSMDVLDSEEDEKKFEERKKARRKGKEVSGTYGTGKAKQNSANLRRVVSSLRKTSSVLIIINQTRDNIGFGAQLKPKVRAGGRAMEFYADIQLWTSLKGTIKKTVKGKPRQVGVMVKASVKRSRITGRKRTVLVPILHSNGIDDVASCVDYLVDEGTWKASGKGGILVTGLGPEWKGSREKVIQKIEQEDMEQDLRELVGETWNEVERACRMDRKRRYE